MSDETTITIDKTTGLVKVHGVPVCQRIKTPDGVVLQIKPKRNCTAARRIDGDKVTIPLSDFVKAVSE